jgi:uncharacterized protein (DUF2225 family)
MFFRKKYGCPLCSTRFRTLKPRQKDVIVEKTDEDFCTYYKTVNPMYYEINVCPKCGYSFNSSTSAPVKPEIKGNLTKTLAELWPGTNYCGSRTLEDAVDTFKLAMACQKLRGADESVMGKMTLKLAWLYRYMKEQALEHQYLEEALRLLSKSFETDTTEDPKEEMNMMFLLGQLHLTLGDDRGAVNWFIRITQHPQRSRYPYVVNRARGIWQDIRQRSKQQKEQQKEQQQQ